MAIQKDIVINRKQYQNIKKMDHNQMNLYIQSIYKSGFEDGKAAVPGVDMQQVSDILKSIKGIGEKRAVDIVKALEKEMMKEVKK
jgi:hypothetical protein|nr:MAG TPA: SCO1480/DNA Complex associated protein [Caudoviricetes sp.]